MLTIINITTMCDFSIYFAVELHNLRIYYTCVNWFMNMIAIFNTKFPNYY